MIKEIPILTIDGNYGGNQYWFRQPFIRLGGCSTISACHVAAELMSQSSLYETLFPFESTQITKRQFMRFAREMFCFVFPGKQGMPKTSMFRDSFLKYAQSKNVAVSSIELSGESKLEEAADFIISAIDAGQSVQFLLLNHKDHSIKDFEWHWFTVTGYEYETNIADLIIIFSSFGKKYTESLSLLWDTGHEEKGGLIRIIPMAI